jgi:hypothetical protein
VLFIEWWHVELPCVLLLIVGIGIVGFWLVRKKKSFVRIPVRFLSVCLALSGVLASSLIAFVSLLPGNEYSVPVYSPNGKMAARIVDYNASGLGGADSWVELFSYHGLKSDVVFSGEWKSVEAPNLRWVSDSELEISYEGKVQRCTSANNVRVRCVGRFFYINVSPSSASLLRGSSYNFTVSLTPLGGTFDSISFSCAGLPDNSSCAFSPVSVTPGSKGASSVMTLTTDKNYTPMGNYTVTITGISSVLTHSTRVQLNVFSKH